MRKRCVAIFSLVIILASGFSPNLFAQEFSKEELLKRISALEQEVRELKSIVTQVQSKQGEVTRKVGAMETQSKKIAQAVQSQGKPLDGIALTSKHKVDFYGFLKLDASYDDSKTNNPDAARYALTETGIEDEAQYAMTAQNSRLGLNYHGPEINAGDIYGNVELDFFDTASDNSQQLRMRHAFFSMKFPEWELLAGQTWDVFGPLGPGTLNTNGYMWNGGNIGFRRPQLRLTNYFDVAEDKKITTQLSINRNIGVGNGTVNTGENSGYPLGEGRLAYTFPLFGQSSTLGVAGLYGIEEYNRNDATNEDCFRIPQWAAGLDVNIPINSKVSVKGEFFHGSNLDAFLAGIGQGINITGEEGIDSTGGWAQLTLKPWKKGTFNFGYGIEDLDEDNLSANSRAKNEVLFVNYVYQLFESANLGFEYNHFETSYMGQDKGDNNRFTTSLIYNF